MALLSDSSLFMHVTVMVLSFTRESAPRVKIEVFFEPSEDRSCTHVCVQIFLLSVHFSEAA